MWGVDAFGVQPFGYVDVGVVAVGPPPVVPLVPTLVAHINGRAVTFALVGRDTANHVAGKQPATLTLGTMQVVS